MSHVLLDCHAFASVIFGMLVIHAVADLFVSFLPCGMVSQSLRDYEEKAVSLALNRPKLRELTNRLKAARLTCPLFDTARWVSNICAFSCECAILFPWIKKQINIKLLHYTTRS